MLRGEWSKTEEGIQMVNSGALLQQLVTDYVNIPSIDEYIFHLVKASRIAYLTSGSGHNPELIVTPPCLVTSPQLT